MDYWEGFLLGPLWSDTDYETRRHAGLILGIGAIVWAAVFLIVLLPGMQSVFISPVSLRLSIGVFIALTLASPFLCRFFYRCPLPLRIVILAVLLLKIVAGMMVPVNLLLADFHLDIDTLQSDAMLFFNDYLGGMIDKFTDGYGGTGMIIGIVVGGLSILLMGTGIALASLIAPRLILAGMRLLQWAYDSLLFRLVFRRLGFN